MFYAIDIIIDNFSVIGNERKKIMANIIQSYFDSPEPLDILGVGYALFYSGANYRRSAIDYFERFLNFQVDISSYKLISLWAIYSNLSTLYEKEYNFEKAIFYLEKCIETDKSSNPADFTRIGDVLVKIDLNKAEKYYLELLSSNSYAEYKYQFEYALKDVQEKIKRGYVYKPHPKQ